MKKTIITLIMTAMLLSVGYSQIVFKGVPVDGTRAEMIRKLKQKGFKFDAKEESFDGEFNGDKISGIILDYKDKVYGIRFIYDVSGFSKALVINRFNGLVQSYETSNKYQPDEVYKVSNDIDSYLIDTYEDIDYEMKKGRVYDAQYLYNVGKYPEDTTGYYLYKKEMTDKYADFYKAKHHEELFEKLLSPGAFYIYRLERDIVHFYIIPGFTTGTYNIMFDYHNRRNAPNNEDL